MGQIVNQRELSDFLDISTVSLSRWSKEGLPVRPPEPGKKGNVYDTAEVVRWMINRRGNPDGEVIDGPFEKARLDRERADAQALKNSAERGDLVSVEAASTAIADLFVTLRSRLLAMPTALAPLLIGHTKLPIVERMISDELVECLNDITADGASALVQDNSRPSAPTGADDGFGVGGQAPEAKPGKQRRARKVANRTGGVSAGDDGSPERPAV